MISKDSIARRAPAAATVALSLVAGAVGGGLVTRHPAEPAVPVTFSSSVHAAVDQGLNSTFAEVVRRSAPAVVNISTSKIIKASAQRSARGNQLPPEFRDFFGGGNFPGVEPPRDRKAQSLGSGVIVNPQGYVLTNNHVVDGADTVKVALPDKREFTAKIVGTDPQTDIAVLKIDGARLPVMPLSDSAKVQVGDVALAIGNPFGIGQTVTMGIVSATGRSGMGIESYEDFIQTDASINPGNSGGALVNTRGELIAVNTAILAGRTGGNQGIGFAVPVNMAREVMDQLIKGGKVTRGYMGVGPQEVTPSIARGFRLPDTQQGVLLNEVQSDSPAAKAGLKEGDIVVNVNGDAVTDVNQFRLRIARQVPGTTVQLKVLRDGKELNVPVTLTAFPADKNKDDNDGDQPGSPSSSNKGALQGVDVDELTPQIARQLGLSRGASGVVVTDVEETSAAAEAGLREGDIIESVNRQGVANVRDFNSALRAGGKSVLLRVKRGERSLFLAIENGVSQTPGRR